MKEENINNEGEEREPLFSEEEMEQEMTDEQMEKKGFKVSESWMYQLFIKSAYRVLHKPLTVFQILKKAVKRLNEYASIRDIATDSKERIQLIVRMLTAFVKGEYKGLSKTNAALSLAGILYFLSPIDLIPDFLAFGLLDDLALLTWIYHNFQGEVEDFLAWEEDNTMIRIEIKGIDEGE